jgi:tRNA 2-selenouridine synthase
MAEVPPGIRPLHEYALVIDARSPHEYADDHLPGAVNLPIVDDAQHAEVGTLHRSDPHAAYVLGSQYALRNIAAHIGSVIAALPPRSRLLVYCFRGGKRSKAWADPLRTIGFPVDVLPGGWKAYRGWVRARLEQLPGELTWRLVSGTTASGKTRLLQALAAAGEQVLDLEAIARHRGSLLGDLPGQPQPPQKRFDSQLLQALQRFDPARPVWVEDESKRIGRLWLPPALYEALQHAPVTLISAPMAARVQACRDDYPQFVADPQAMVARLAPLKPVVGGATLQEWAALAQAGAVDALFEQLMRVHYDPCYRRSMRRPREQPRALALPDLQPATLQRVAQTLAATVPTDACARQPSPPVQEPLP